MNRKVSRERSTLLPQRCRAAGHPRELYTGMVAVPGTALHSPLGKIILLLKQGKIARAKLQVPPANLPPLSKLAT